MKGISFRRKLSITFILFTLVFLGVSNYLVYRKAVSEQMNALRSRIVDLAKLSSMLIDADTLVRIEPRLESQGTQDYARIRRTLKSIRNIDPIIDDVYTMVKTNKEGVLAFLVSAGDAEGVMAYCGERYDITAFPQMLKAFVEPSVDKEITQDKWGAWLSGYAPIFNNKGEAVAIVGLDVSADSVKNMQDILTRNLMIVLTIGILLSLLLSWFIIRKISRPLYSLVVGTRQIGEGNFGYRVNVRSRDEFFELATSFNKMAESLMQAQARIQKYYLDTVKTLARALEAKDTYTKGHSERVAFYAVNIAKQLGLADEEIKMLEDVCILHDIGKIGVPERILTKPDSLSEEEWRVVKLHPKIGEEILEYIEFLKPGLSIVKDHHERIDGKGYPRGLRTEEISILASIVIVADAYDAMTSDRPYRKALTQNQAIAVLRDNKGTQFDAKIVDAFVKYLQDSG